MIWPVITLFMLLGLATIAVMARLFAQLSARLASLEQQLGERLKETAFLLQDAHKTVGERLDSATRVFGEVQKSLGRLEGTQQRILDISKDISSLQDLLRAPKFRGEIGETLLGKLLEDILPKENVKLQHRFKSGDIADAVIAVGGHLIPIDAKFPLENFKKASDAPSEEEKKSSYRVFVRDVKKRIDEVSSKYILPDEDTFDFALMYIPAEAVYYQISRDDELGAYAHAKRVVFVSPNTFYAYLQAILYGLRGMNIQRNVQKIFADLARLQVDFKKFHEDFSVVGRHLLDAAARYNDAKARLEQLGQKLIGTTRPEQIESDRQ